MLHQAHKRIIVLLILYFSQNNAYDLPEEIGEISISNRQHYHVPEQTEFYNENYNYHRIDKDDDQDEPEKQVKINPAPKSLKEDGWKPMIGGRSVERNTEMFKAQHAVQLQKLRERYLEYLNSKSEPVSTTTENRLKWERNVNRDHPKATSWDYNVNSQIYVGPERQINFTKSYENSPSKNFRFDENSYSSSEHKIPEFRETKVEKKPKMLKEDDIMWMHYGPPSEEGYRYRTTRNEKPTTVAPTTEMSYKKYDDDKKTSDWLEYGLQYFLNYPREDDKSNKKSPKNIYEIIDKNNRDDFKPVFDAHKRHTHRGSFWEENFENNENRKSDNLDRLIKSTDTAEPIDDDSLIDLYKAIYGPEGNTNERENETENEIKPIEKQSESHKNAEVKSKAQSLGGFVDNYRNVEPPHAFGFDHKPKLDEQNYYKVEETENVSGSTETLSSTEKSIHESWWLPEQIKPVDHKTGKFLGKPIVITEPTLQETRLTAEYYRKLFDSFGGHDANDYKGNTKKNLQHNSTSMRKIENSLEDYYEHANDLNRAPKSYSPKDELNEKHDSIINETATHEKTENCGTKAERKNRNIPLEKSENSTNTEKPRHKTEHESFNFFKFMGINVKDLVPKTLRTNIFLIKRLITDCYSGYNKGSTDGYATTCLKKITIKALDKAISSQVIKITDSVYLIKENSTDLAEDENSARSSTDLIEVEWLPNMLEKIMKLFSTHSLKVQLVNPQEDQNFQVEGRRRHYRRVFPIMVGAYMILSTVLIPLGFKFMTLLGTKSLLVSKISLIIALMGSIKKFFGYGAELALQSPYSSLYPTPAYPSFYPSYYDPWRRDEYRKISQFDDPTEYSHYSEEVE